MRARGAVAAASSATQNPDARSSSALSTSATPPLSVLRIFIVIPFLPNGRGSEEPLPYDYGVTTLVRRTNACGSLTWNAYSASTRTATRLCCHSDTKLGEPTVPKFRVA